MDYYEMFGIFEGNESAMNDLEAEVVQQQAVSEDFEMRNYWKRPGMSSIRHQICEIRKWILENNMEWQEVVQMMTGIAEQAFMAGCGVRLTDWTPGDHSERLQWDEWRKPRV